MAGKHAGYDGIRVVVCAVLFVAALVGSVVCGVRMDAARDAAHEVHLRRLIYLHFLLSQLAVFAAIALIWAAHRRWRRFYLIVSYNERGMLLDPPGVVMPPQRVYRCHLHGISKADLPPPGPPVLVYPMFMLSGKSSGEKLEQLLQQAYADSPRPPKLYFRFAWIPSSFFGRRCIYTQPKLYFQPVLGASPWLAQAAAHHIRPLLGADTGVLVVAHGSDLVDPPPEPALFCRRLRKLLPNTEVKLGFFRQQPDARAVLREMLARDVLLLPFLLTNGIHAQRDLPTQQDARSVGKSLQRLPVAAELLYRENHDETGG